MLNKIEDTPKYDQSLSREFNQLIQEVSNEVIDSTALRTLKQTTTTLRKELPHLEEMVNKLNDEANSLKATTYELEKVNLSEITETIEKVSDHINDLEDKITLLEKVQKDIKINQNKQHDEIKKELRSVKYKIEDQLTTQENKLHEKLDLLARGNQMTLYFMMAISIFFIILYYL